MSLMKAAEIAHYTHHDALPSGFAYADAVQSSLFVDTGSIPGASKVCIVKGEHYDPTDDYPHVHLGMRLRPPRFDRDITSGMAQGTPVARYIAEYNNGWQAANRGTDSKAWDSGLTSDAWDDGYLDRAAGRAKWHLTYCVDHDNCGEG